MGICPKSNLSLNQDRHREEQRVIVECRTTAFAVEPQYAKRCCWRADFRQDASLDCLDSTCCYTVGVTIIIPRLRRLVVAINLENVELEYHQSDKPQFPKPQPHSTDQVIWHFERTAEIFERNRGIIKLSSSLTLTFFSLPSPITKRVLPQPNSSVHQNEYVRRKKLEDRQPSNRWAWILSWW